MELSRRDLFRASGTALVTGGIAVGAEGKAVAATRDPEPLDRTADPAGNLAEPPGQVEAAFRDLLAWMIGHGWSEYLYSTVGLDLEAALRNPDRVLIEPLPTPTAGDFADFGGLRAVQPGDPAMSLLYHALASSDVALRGGDGRPAPSSAYPSPAQIDALENYIYSRAKLGVEGEGDGLVLAVFAYEYRASGKTPHKRHSDLVYARTGVARAGTDACNWDPVARSYVNKPEQNTAPEAVAVTPARYGLFLARQVKRGRIFRIGKNSQDKGLTFLLPIRKLYDGCPHLHGRRLAFAEAHRDEKLFRLTDFVPLPPGETFDTCKPPFIRRSASRAVVGVQTNLHGHDSELAGIQMLTGSATVTPAARPLVCEAFQGRKRLRFIVPRAKESHLGFTSNRRYTTLKLLKKPLLEVVDFVLSDFVFAGGRYTTGFRSPRNGPVFVNIRHKVGKDGKLVHLGTDKDLKEIEKGGYEAAMFLDGLCDGCVEAQLEDPAGGAQGASPAWLKPPLPAFSLVAAPDFFPRFDPIDLARKDFFFLEGGTETASGGRLPANPNIPRPSNPSERAFPPNLGDKRTLTVTAAVSAPPNQNRPERRAYRKGDGVNTLPDTVSNVFAPGWDVTYSKERILYYATFGLGSPFPEDMKLCAAANGMWAGSSPDASRTFYPDLEPIPVLGRPSTAMPMTDHELGFHPASPGATEHKAPDARGWDGEYGPFVRILSGGHGSTIGVDYADMNLSDYVVNARSCRLDLGRMRQLSAADIIERMEALQACIWALPGKDKVRNTKLWLVSAEKVENWSGGASGLGIPTALGGRDGSGRIPPAPNVRGPGWLYVFAARAGKPCKGIEAGRRMQPVSRLFVCQVASRIVCSAVIDAAAGTPPELRWS